MAGKKTLGSLLVSLGMTTKDADKAIRDFEKKLKDTGKRMTEIGRSMSIGFTAPFLLAMGKSIKAFDEEATVTRKLQIALGGTSKALLDQAAALQKVTTFADDEIITQQAWAAALGHSESQIKDMTDAAVGLAAGLGIGLDEAMKGLHQTTMGQTKSLGRLIPGIKEMTQEQLKSGAAIDLVKEKFAGYAEAMALTGAGPLKVLKNQLGDLSEQMGEAVLPIVVALSEKIKELITWFQNLSPEVKEAIVAWGLVVAAIGPLLVLIPKVVAGFVALSGPVGLVTLGILTLGAGILWVVDNWTALERRINTTKIGSLLLENMKDLKGFMANPLLGWLSGGDVGHPLINTIKTITGGKVGGNTKGPGGRAQSWFDAGKDLNNPLESLTNWGGKIFDFMGGDTGKDMIAEANKLIEEMAAKFKGLGKDVAGATKELKDYSRVLSDIGQHVTAALVPNRGGGGIPKIAPGSMTNPNTVSGSDWAMSPDGGFKVPTEGMDEMTNSAAGLAEMMDTLKGAVSSAMGVVVSALDEGGKSFGQFALEAVKAAAMVVRAKLMEIAVNVIFGETSKFGLPGLIAGIVGATAGIAAISALLSGIKAPALASGGLAYGPTMAMVGDNRNAHVDPEVISPLSKLKGMMGGGSGGGGEVRFVIRGNDLHGIMRNMTQKNQRLGNATFTFNGKDATGGDG